MSLPAFAPTPSSAIRLSLAPAEWETCMDAWLTLSELALRLPTAGFNSAFKGSHSLPAFLTSFYHELATLKLEDTTLRSSKAVFLKKYTYKLTKRAFDQLDDVPPPLLLWDFLSDFSQVHLKNKALHGLMSSIWKRKSGQVSINLNRQREVVIKELELKMPGLCSKSLSQLAVLMHGSAEVGAFFMTGSDFLDALATAYAHVEGSTQRKSICLVLHLGLLSLVKVASPNLSSVSDHLYSLEAQANKSKETPSLLSDLVTNTSLLTQLRLSFGSKTPERMYKLLDQMATYRSPSLAYSQTRRTVKRRPKAEGTAIKIHVHRLSLVTQIQDLFPHLGSGFVLKLLDAYEDNVEQVTAGLLDDSLPEHLASLDRSEPAPIFDTSEQAEIDHLAPRSTPPPPETYITERRNRFDGEELHGLEVGTSRLYIGKQSRDIVSKEQPNKAAILSALAAFDSDDDERDDTYDVEDVGGTVDTSHPDGELGTTAKVTQEENEMALFTAYKANPELFGRTFDVRRGQARSALKSETGMTDEAIEGWAIMLQRDPKRSRRLEVQLGSFDGRQESLVSTAYREGGGGTETEDSDAPGGGLNGRGGSRGRGRGGRGRGRDRPNNVAGASNDPSTANSQRRKEANKGSRANHNRRDQRAKKMARGAFAG